SSDLAGEARKAGDEPVGHEDDNENEDGAEDEVPALDVGAGYVLDHDDKAGAHYRTEEGAGASGDHHEERLGGGGEGHRLWADDLVVVEIVQAGHPGPQPREQERDEADHPDVVAERVHAPRLVAGPPPRPAERRGGAGRT